MGAGMFCIEGNGTISHMSIHHVPELFNEPLMFAALHVKGQENGSKVIEGNVPEWKKVWPTRSNLGISNPAWGFPRFDRARFTARFLLRTSSSRMTICRWMRKSQPGVLSFLPMKMIRDCLPEHFEYRFTNRSAKEVEAVFSYNSNLRPSQPPGTGVDRAGWERIHPYAAPRKPTAL